MINALLNALGVFILMIGSIGLILNAPQLNRMIKIKSKKSFNQEEKHILGSLVEYHASMLAASMVAIAIGSYLVFIR